MHHHTIIKNFDKKMNQLQDISSVTSENSIKDLLIKKSLKRKLDVNNNSEGGTSYWVLRTLSVHYPTSNGNVIHDLDFCLK